MNEKSTLSAPINDIYQALLEGRTRLAVVGLGYVGLPLAVSFGEKLDVVGFDVNEEKIAAYRQGRDVTNEVGDEALAQHPIAFTADETELEQARFFVVAVPTDVHDDKTPDLSAVKAASRIVGKRMPKNSIVVYESTVYPGVTEDTCIPILEEESGLQCGVDFTVGYSPERINPGDRVHTVKNILKIVSGLDERTRKVIGQVYRLAVEGGIYEAPSIQVAEATKLVENAQRDINIAFMNEISMAFDRMGIPTKEVIDAMNTKWNALGFYPGLVGGHCIGVDPYYLIHKAERLGYHSPLVAAGRRVNDDMPLFVAQAVIRQLVRSGKDVQKAAIYLLGATFKGNCPDLRNSKAKVIKNELESYGCQVRVVEPQADPEEVERQYGVWPTPLEKVRDADCLILTADHREFQQMTAFDLAKLYRPDGNRVLIDVRNLYPRGDVEAQGISYWSL